MDSFSITKEDFLNRFFIVPEDPGFRREVGDALNDLYESEKMRGFIVDAEIGLGQLSIPEQKGSIRRSKTGPRLGSEYRALARVLPA